tara:strand:+ start:9127 stop:9321 length:195 start_codon:yes stop_codon:yes gene_type:complete
METIEITCTNNGKIKPVEVLTKTDKYLKVILPGTEIVLELFREDLNSEYTGITAGLQFEWLPKN